MTNFTEWLERHTPSKDTDPISTGPSIVRRSDDAWQKTMFRLQFVLFWWVVISSLFFFVQVTQTSSIPYDDFLAYVRAGRVEAVTIKGDEITGMLREQNDRMGTGKSTFTMFRTMKVDKELTDQLDSKNVKFEVKQENGFWASFLGTMASILFLTLVFNWVYGRGGDRSIRSWMF